MITDRIMILILMLLVVGALLVVLAETSEEFQGLHTDIPLTAGPLTI